MSFTGQDAFVEILARLTTATSEVGRLKGEVEHLQTRVNELSSASKYMSSEAAHDFQELFGALAAGKKIEAIKWYRQITGQGLKESKDAIEAATAPFQRTA